MIYAFNEYELDTLALELRKDGEIVHLEPQVFGVLAHLVENRDRVVSKIELLDEVWPDRFVSESAITSRLLAARRATGDSGREQRVIRTKHGRGYRFVADVVELDGTERIGTPDPAVSTPMPTYDASSLFGRRDEMEELEAAASAALGGRGRMVFVTGEPGIGKSALVESALERLDPTTGGRLLSARCRVQRSTGEPYVSVLDAISRFGREHPDTVAVLEQVAPLWLLQLPSLLETDRIEAISRRALGGTHDRMLREGIDLLDHVSRRAPLVVWIEDLHWADPSTLELIEWLADRVDSCAMLVIATIRPGEEAGGELVRLVHQLEIDRTVQRMDLAPLDADALGSLIRDNLQAEAVEPDLLGVVIDRSGGNPLFASELIDSWLVGGEIEVVEGQVQGASGVEDIGRAMPGSIRQLIERGLDRMDTSDVMVLEAAAVAGAEFPAFAVAAALDRPVADIEDRLGAVARRGSLLMAVGDNSWPDGTVSTTFRIAHDLHHRVLYDRIAASRRATMHQAIGERLETACGDRRDEHLAILLRHFTATGDTERLLGYLHRTGELALARGAHAEAIAPLEAALDRLVELPPGPERDRREMRIRITLGPAMVVAVGWRDEAVGSNFERALEIALRLDADPDRFVARYGLAAVHELRGEYNRSEELLREQMADGSQLGVETRELLACSTFHQGSFEAALEHARATIAMWEPESHSEYMARHGEHPGVSGSTWGALSAWFLGRPRLSMEMAEQALEWGADNDYALTTALAQLAFLYQYRDERDQCRAYAERTIDVATVQGFPFRAAQARILIGWCQAATGDLADGLAAVEDGMDRYRATGARMDEPYYVGLHADALRRAAEPDRAVEQLDRAATIIDATTRTFFYQPELTRMRALCVDARDGPGARDDVALLLRLADREADELGAVALALRITVTAIDMGLPAETDGTRARLEALLEPFRSEPDLPDVARATALLERSE